jgi:hypothetical protein
MPMILDDRRCHRGLHVLAPPNREASAGTNIHGAHVPVEEPSAASYAASRAATKAS